MRNRTIAILALVLVLLAGAPALDYPTLSARQRPATKSSSSGLELDSIDRGIDPCTDFYQFACGGWMAQHPLPPALAGWGRGREMRERTSAVLLRILSALDADPERRNASNYYLACMDEASIEAKGLLPLRPVLSRIGALNNLNQLPALTAYLHSVAYLLDIPLRQLPYGALFDFRPQQEVLGYIASVNPGGIALPDRHLYFSNDARSVMLRQRYKDHVREMLAFLGASDADAIDGARAVLAIETALATAYPDVVSQRMSDTHPTPLAELQAMTASFDWHSYLIAASTPAIRSINVTSPEFVRALGALLAGTPITDLKQYLRWQVVHASVLLMPLRFRQSDFAFFGRALKGQQESGSRPQLCITETDDHFGDVLGKAFVEATFDQRSKSDMLTMFRAITDAMRADIEAAGWLSAQTKLAATTKLAAILGRIGYPNRWRRDVALRMTRSDALGNLQRALRFDRVEELKKISREVDPEEWQRLTPSRAEAGYRAERNDIVFPAGFLQQPFYNAARDPAVNYGAIGAVIGHEVTHGFDDVGRQFDSQGHWRNWWTDADANAFKQRAACLVDQYSQYTVADGTKVNGSLTLGENIADAGGVRLALLAYLAGPGIEAPGISDQFTPSQRFFLGWAQAWCINVRPEAERLQIATDPHAPNRYRVNGPLSNMPEFQNAFSCKPDAAMVRPNACRVW